MTKALSPAKPGPGAAYDAAAVRRQFPIMARTVNGKPLHYLDNAASAQTPRAVLDAVTEHESVHRSNVMRSVHQLAEEATEAYAGARQTLADYVNAGAPEEIVFTSGTTDSINLVAHAFGQSLGEGDEIVISRVEHHSNIVPWQMLAARSGAVVKALPATGNGEIDLAALSSTITERCRIVAISHGSNVTGGITDLAAVVEAARGVGARVLVDGAQWAPHGPFDVAALDVDFYAFSGHKMFGPNGIGVLWGRRELLDSLPPFKGGGEMIRTVTLEKTTFAPAPHRFEAGTPPIAQAVGMAAAARWLSAQDLSGAEAHLARLTGRVMEGIATIGQGKDRAHIRLVGPPAEAARLPVVSFITEGLHPHDICQILDGHGVALRGGHHCAQPLMDHFGVTGTTRASLALYNDDGDVDAFLNGLEDAISRLRQFGSS